MSKVPPTPDHILSTLQAYRDAAALNTAIELDIFTRIARGVDTATKLAAQLNIPVRGVRLVCEYLAATGLLQMEDEQFKLTPDTAVFLDKESPQYLGAAARVLYSPALLRSFEHLTDAVRAGAAPTAPKGRPDWFDLARGVHLPVAVGQAFAAAVNLPPGPLKVLEIGSRDGALGIALARHYPEAVIVAIDTPGALAAAQVTAEAAGLGTRYQNIPGDPLVVDLGLEYDAIVISGLYQYDESQIASLLMRIHYALKKGGPLLILEFLSEDNADFVRQYAGLRLNVLAATPRGDAYSMAALRGMLESSGFHSIDTSPLPIAAASLVIAKL